MIQATANPAAGTFPLSAGLQVTQGEDGGNPLDFASILAVSMPAESDKAPANAAQAEAIVAAMPKPILQVAGKTTGKALPLSLPASLPLPAEETSSETADSAADGDSDAVATQNRIDDISAIVAAALPTPTPILAGMRDAAQPVLTGTADAPVAMSGRLSSRGEAAPSQAPMADASDAPRIAAATTPAAKPTAIPDALLQLRIGMPQPSADTTADAVPVPQTTAEALAVQTIMTEPRPSRGRTIADRTASRQADTTLPAVSADAKPVLDTAEAPNGSDAGRRNQHIPAVRPAVDTPSSMPTGAATSAATTTLTTPDSLPDAPLSAELQPVPVMRDSQPVVAGNPQTSPAAPAQQSGHEFAALIDRLVEAREGAAPQTVQAAISHTEFGHVSLRFDQDDSGLRVAMSSADPDFAPAVQAAAAANPAGNDDSGQPRQDGNARQDGPAFTGQQQSQSSASGTRNGATAGNVARNAGHEMPDEDRGAPDRHDGIYA
jgi:hypothetical protein